MALRNDMTESALEFPCIFPIKAIGFATDDFDLLVIGIIRRHAPEIGEGAVRTRASRNGKYLCVTVTIEAICQEQLDAIYQELSRHERIVMAL